MKTSEAGKKLLEQLEGLRLKPYLCQAGKLTIGVGSTGPHVKPGMVITRAQAYELLEKDLARFEQAVDSSVKVATTQAMFDAMVLLAFNIGVAAFKGSSLVRLLNAGKKPTEVESNFIAWNKVTDPETGRKETSKGQVRRRGIEYKLFIS